MFDELVRGKDGGSGYQPRADVWETREEMIFELDLPGFDKKEVNVQVRDNAVVVRGMRKRKVEGNVTVHLKERTFGEFERTFTVPANVDQSKIKAKFDNGMLRITMPKEEIEIEATEVKID
jgi:HSP20 family protein